MFRFTIRDLLWLTVVVGMGCVGLKYASPVWVSIFFSVIILLLSTTALGAIWLSGVKKASCQGFLVTGGFYFLLAFGPGFSETVAPGLPSGAIANQYLFPLLRREVPARSVHMPDGTPVSSIRGNVTYVAVPFLPDLVRLSHALGVLVSAIIGAGIARWFACGSSANENQQLSQPS